MPPPDSYTVGWICAITTEYVAARAFLDVEHERPHHVSPNDNNDYTLGKVGEHNVVIAVLPHGEYGISSAASVARDMLHSFPNVRIGLMVGIGGGAPSRRHDIRLGDIVVSTPRGGNGGVFQYDFGKTIQDQSFRPTAVLNQSPTLLRTTVSGLEAEYELKGHRLDEAINNLLEKNRRLQKYKRPNPSTDRLYKSEFTHPLDDEASCADYCGDDESNLKFRPKRTEDDDNPAIHYGLIASANQLMKNALVRDTITAEKDVLCFEMEAAGLMNHFPCLVIRGICDYSDTHKNKEWQGYAAMAAAAYTKDILNRISPKRIEAEKKIIDVLSSVETGVNEIRITTQDTSNAVRDLGNQHKREKIERWLSPPDPSTNHNKALKQRDEGSGAWFLESDAFAKWKKGRNSFLWLCGIPGCGKTILSSAIIKNLDSVLSSQPLLYFYFDFTDTGKQTLESMLRTLIIQLYHKRVETSQHLGSLFSSCQNGHCQPTSESLRKAFFDMIHQVKEIWLVLDALDECHSRSGSSAEGVLSWIRELLNSEQRNVHLIVASRPVHDIESGIMEFAHNDDVVPIQSSDITHDIAAHVRNRVRGDDRLKRWRSRPDVQEEIEINLVGKANGMFRWAACQLDALEHCLDYRSLQQALASLPKTLDETYARILFSIPDEHKQNAIRILQFLTYSERPLRIDEAVDLITVDTGEAKYFNEKYRMPDPSEISRYCSSLVVLVSARDNWVDDEEDWDDEEEDWDNEEDNTVRLQLAHFSVKEYLTSTRLDKDIAQNFHETAARGSMATVCLAYLLHIDMDLLAKGIRQRFPLAQYSARYWMSNAAVAEGQDHKLGGFISQFFCCHKSSYNNCYSLYRPDQPPGHRPDTSGKPASALYYASFGGLVNAVELLLSKGADVNAQGGYCYGNALQAASVNGHTAIVELLLRKGADVNAQEGYHGNAQEGYHGNALQAASIYGYTETVELLLSKGADVNIEGGYYYGNALQAASFNGYTAIVELLLSKGADVNAQGGYFYGNALQAASTKGHTTTVELLLSKGADVNARGGHYGNALQAASAEGHTAIVELLLSTGADVNAQGGHYGNALQAASSRGHTATVELLLNRVPKDSI